MVNINQFTKMSNSLEITTKEPANGPGGVQTPEKMNSQRTSSDPLLIKTNKAAISTIELQKMKPQSPTSNDRDATTQGSLTVRKSQEECAQ